MHITKTGVTGTTALAHRSWHIAWRCMPSISKWCLFSAVWGTGGCNRFILLCVSVVLQGAALLWVHPSRQDEVRPLVCSHGYGLGFRGEFLWQVSGGDMHAYHPYRV
jgi:hypothetical protein